MSNTSNPATIQLGQRRFSKTVDTPIFNGSRNERSRAKKVREDRKEKGLCAQCGKPKNTDTVRCAACTAWTVANNKSRALRSAQSGLCPTCRKPWVGTTIHCEECKALGRAKWKNKPLSGYCTRCAAPRDRAQKSCQACGDAMKAVSERRRSKYRASGCCTQCPRPTSSPGLALCATCLLKSSARRWLGDSARWGELLSMFNEQGGQCTYTGEPLVIGLNASLDHKIPRARGGANDIGNLHWITLRLNQVKRDLTHDEFIEVCLLVASRFPAHSPKAPGSSTQIYGRPALTV